RSRGRVLAFRHFFSGCDETEPYCIVMAIDGDVRDGLSGGLFLCDAPPIGPLHRRAESRTRESFMGKLCFSNPKTMPAPRGYTQVVETTGPGRTIYLSGQLGMTAGGVFAGAPGDFRAQATQCFENLKAGLASGRRWLPARGEAHQLLRRHESPAGVLRGARHV